MKIEEAGKAKLTFGIFKGYIIENVPSGYLKWIAENVSNERVCTAADIEWRWREENDEHFEMEIKK